LPVSVVPAIAFPGAGSLLYVAFAFILGAGQLAYSVRFWQQPNDNTARSLLRASLIYLPTLLVMLMLALWI
jgi:protoheme IX farnesyltransferase